MLNVHKKLITSYVKSEVFAMLMNPKNKETIQSIISRSAEYTHRLAFLVNDGKCKTMILIQEKRHNILS